MNETTSIDSLASHRCGACKICCTHLPIAAGIVGPESKAVGVPCRYQDHRGCRIYARRPEVCADFACAWLDDLRWPDAWRPDQCGLLCLREEVDAGLFASAVYEIRPGALDAPAAAEILDQLRQTTAAVVIVNTVRQRRCLAGHAVTDVPHAGAPVPHFAAPVTSPVSLPF